MRLLLGLAVYLTPLAALSAVITYDDGSTYTLEEGESVYVTSAPVFSATKTTEGYEFDLVRPNVRRDHGSDVTFDDYPVASEEWCELYVPWSEGYTFNMQYYQRFCPQWREYVDGGES